MRYFSYDMMYYRILKNKKKSIFWKNNRPGVGSDLKTLKTIRISKQKSKSRSETLKIPSSLSYETKLKFVEIVMISVSYLAPALAILVVIIF